MFVSTTNTKVLSTIMMEGASHEINMKLDNRLTIIDVSSGKQKPFKTVRKSPNAYLIFANEHRNSLAPAIKNDKSTHPSTVLGSMWRKLTDAQKEKYYTESKRLQNLLMMSEESGASSRKRTERKSKNLCGTAPKNPSGHQRKKKNMPSSLISNIESQEVIVSEKVEIMAESTETSLKIENKETLNKPTDPRIRRNNLVNPDYPDHQNQAVSNPPQTPSSVDPRHTSPSCYPPTSPPYLNSGASSYFNCGFPGMPQPYFGAPPLPPLFPAYSLNASCHQPVSAPWFSCAPLVCYPPSYSYCLPYSYSNSTFNGYNNNYGAQYSRSVMGSTTYAAYQSTASARNASADVLEECTNSKKSGENSEDEHVTVDEGVSDNKDDKTNGID